MSERYGQTGEKKRQGVLVNEGDNKSRRETEREQSVRIRRRRRRRRATLIPAFRDFDTNDNFSLSVPVFTVAKQALQSNSTIISRHGS